MNKKYQSIYADPQDRIICRICGRQFRFLGSHLRKHGTNEIEYKDEFGILHLLPLCDEQMSDDISRKQKANVLAGRLNLDKMRARIDRSKLTHPSPPQTREVYSKIKKGKKLTNAHKEKIALAKIGTHQSEETKAKISQAMIGNTHTLGHHLSKEHKAKLSILYWARAMK